MQPTTDQEQQHKNTPDRRLTFQNIWPVPDYGPVTSAPRVSQDQIPARSSPEHGENENMGKTA